MEAAYAIARRAGPVGDEGDGIQTLAFTWDVCGMIAVATVGLADKTGMEVVAISPSDEAPHAREVIRHAARLLTRDDHPFLTPFEFDGRSYSCVALLPMPVVSDESESPATRWLTACNQNPSPVLLVEVVPVHRGEDPHGNCAVPEELESLPLKHGTPSRFRNIMSLAMDVTQDLMAGAIEEETDREGEEDTGSVPRGVVNIDQLDPEFRPAPFHIDGFGDVEVKAQFMEIGAVGDFEALDLLDAEVTAYRFTFELGAGDIIAECLVRAFAPAIEDMRVLSCSDGGEEWASTFLTRDGVEMAPFLAGVWCEADDPGAVPTAIVRIDGIGIAPAFFSESLLAHVLATVQWAVKAASEYVDQDDEWGFTVEPVGAQDARPVELSDSARAAYEQAFRRMGAVKAGPVDHAFDTDGPPQYCDEHLPVYLLPAPNLAGPEGKPS